MKKNILPLGTESLKETLTVYLRDWHHLIFKAHDKGCQPLEMMVALFPRENQFQRIEKNDVLYKSSERSHLDFSRNTVTYYTKNGEEEETFALPDWMSKFYKAYKSFWFKPDYSEYVLMAGPYDNEFGLQINEVNVGYYKYNRLNGADCMTILQFIDEGVLPLVLPGAFYSARLLPRPKGFSFKHIVDRNKVHVSAVTLCNVYRGKHDFLKLSPETKKYLEEEGISYGANGPSTDERNIPGFDYDERAIPGTRIVFEEPGIKQVLNFLPQALEDLFGIKDTQIFSYTLSEKRGVLWLAVDPKLVAQILGMDLTRDDGIPLQERATLPSLEGWYHLTHLERLLQEKHNSERYGIKMTASYFGLEYQESYWYLEFDQDIHLTKWTKNKESHYQDGAASEKDFLSKVIEKAEKKGILPQGFGNLPWKRVTRNYFPPRFTVEMEIINDSTEDLCLVREPDTGFCYYACPASGKNSSMEGTIKGFGNRRFEFEPEE